MKIYYIASFKKLWDEECIAQALENLGHEVKRKEQWGPTTEEFLTEIQDYKPDFVFFAKLLTRDQGRKLIFELKKRQIPTVSWTFDLYCDYYREKDILQKPFFQADYVFTTDGGHEAKFKEYGVNHFCVRQGIYAPQAVLGNKKPKYIHDVVFVGTKNSQYPFRDRLIGFLGYNYDFAWYGQDNADAVRGMELNDLYASAKIVVGDSVPSPYYWSNRLYETSGRGGFLLFPDIPGIKQEYPMIDTFRGGDLEDLKTKIDYYLVHDVERVAKQLEMFEFTKSNYTYEQRCQEILGILEQASGGTIG